MFASAGDDNKVCLYVHPVPSPPFLDPLTQNASSFLDPLPANLNIPPGELERQYNRSALLISRMPEQFCHRMLELAEEALHSDEDDDEDEDEEDEDEDKDPRDYLTTILGLLVGERYDLFSEPGSGESSPRYWSEMSPPSMYQLRDLPATPGEPWTTPLLLLRRLRLLLSPRCGCRRRSPPLGNPGFADGPLSIDEYNFAYGVNATLDFMDSDADDEFFEQMDGVA